MAETVSAEMVAPKRRRRNVLLRAFDQCLGMCCALCFTMYHLQPCKCIQYCTDDHRLNGSSSPVLTATCLSYGSLCDFLGFFPNRPGRCCCGRSAALLFSSTNVSYPALGSLLPPPGCPRDPVL